MIFNNRELRIRVAKTIPTEENPETKPSIFEDPEIMQDMFKDFLKTSAIIIGCSIVAGFVLHTISEIIIKNATNDNE